MTQFLLKVQDEVLKGKKQRNTVQNLSPSFTSILKTIYPTKRKLTELKQTKKDYLKDLNAPSFWLQSTSESLSYYKDLHAKFIESPFGNKLENK